jgi:hypothetical protein
MRVHRFNSYFVEQALENVNHLSYSYNERRPKGSQRLTQVGYAIENQLDVPW